MLKHFDKLERKATKRVLALIEAIFELVFPKFKRTTKAERMLNLIISMSYIFAGIVLILAGIKGITRYY